MRHDARDSARRCRMHITAMKHGFTLLEILVAMSMMAILTGSLYASLNIGFRARRHSEESLVPVRAADIAFEIIGRDLACAPPPRGILAGQFSGDTKSMSFFTRPMSTREAAPGIIMVEYSLLPSETDGSSMLARHITVNLLAQVQPEPLLEKLCYGIQAIDISYFDGTAWFETWDSTTRGDVLPAAVEISISQEVRRSSRAEPEVHGFRRVFLLPCAAPAPGEEGAEIT